MACESGAFESPRVLLEKLTATLPPIEASARGFSFMCPTWIWGALLECPG